MFAGTLRLFCNTSSLVAYCTQTCCILLYLRCLSLLKIFRKICLSLISSQHVFAHCVFYADVLHSRRFEIVKIVFVLFNHFVLLMDVCRATEFIVLCDSDATLCVCEFLVFLKTSRFNIFGCTSICYPRNCEMHRVCCASSLDVQSESSTSLSSGIDAESLSLRQRRVSRY